MKKFIVAFAVTLVALFSARAQCEIELSVKAGVGGTGWIGKESDYTDAQFGYRMGLGVDVPIKGIWGFQTGLNFVGAGASANLDLGQWGDYKVNVHQLYLEVPLMPTATVDAGKLDIVFNFGPYLAVGVGGKARASVDGESVSVKTFDSDENFETGGMGLKRFDVGLGFGVGFEFSRFLVGIDTRFGLMKLHSDAKIHNYRAFLTVGYKF